MRAAGLGRVSTEEQAQEGHSLEAQREKILQYIQLQGWTLVGYYSDPGFSGKNLNRPDVQRLLKEIEKGNIDVLVVHKLDRLTRNIGDLHELLKLFDKYKVKFVSITENLDTSSAMGRMFVYLLGIFAQWYRENLAEEVKKGMSQRAKKGLHNVSNPMYGYDRGKDGELIIKPEEAKWVQWIFEQYLAGIGSKTIAHQLNRNGIRRTRGSRWDSNNVLMVLTNWHYVGKIHWKEANLPESERIIVDGNHEPIITISVFEAAQTILTRRKEGLTSRNSYEYVFGGIIRCGSCGAKYKAKYNKRSEGKIYRGYVCSNNEGYGTCSQPGISELNLTKLIFQSIQLVPELTEWNEVPEKDERAELVKLLEVSETRRTRWQMAFGDGHMPYDDFAKLMREEMEHASGLQAKLEKLSAAPTSRVSPEEAMEELRKLELNWPKLEQLTRKQIMQSLFQAITISKQEGKWNISDIVLA